MIVYRIAHVRYQNETLSGIGAEKMGGRWNKVGTRAVYCSENVSLALLEYYIHSQNISYLPKEILVARIEFPDAFEIRKLSTLPKYWNGYPYGAETTEVFSDLVLDNDFFALKVPSAIVGIEHNYILNPLFKGFNEVKVIEFVKLPIDMRLTSSTRS